MSQRSVTSEALETKQPTICAVIALHNGEKFIAEAIRSVFAQTILPDELIVVDDGSSDGGADRITEIEAPIPVRVLRTPTQSGQSVARNVGIEASSHDLIALLDQDDIWYPTHLEKLRAPFLEMGRDRPLGWVYSDVDESWEDGSTVSHGMLRNFKATHPKRSLADCLITDMYVLPSATLISRTAIDVVGGFDERLSGYEDDDLFIRIFLAGFDNEYIATSLSTWRMHAGSSGRSPRMARSRLIYLEKMVEFCGPDRHDHRGRYFVGDMVARRMLRSAGSELVESFKSSDREGVQRAVASLSAIKPYVRRRDRLIMTVGVPVLRSFGVGRAIVLIGTHRVARKVL